MSMEIQTENQENFDITHEEDELKITYDVVTSKPEWADMPPSHDDARFAPSTLEYQVNGSNEIMQLSGGLGVFLSRSISRYGDYICQKGMTLKIFMDDEEAVMCLEFEFGESKVSAYSSCMRDALYSMYMCRLLPEGVGACEMKVVAGTRIPLKYGGRECVAKVMPSGEIDTVWMTKKKWLGGLRARWDNMFE